MKYKLPNGNEILLGQDIYGTWNVTCWDKDYNLIWRTKFDKQSDAQVRFDECKKISLT
jgi:hypothetical protein